MNHNSEHLKVIYTKSSMFCAIINYQCKRSEQKNAEKLVKQTGQALEPKVDWKCAFLHSL